MSEILTLRCGGAPVMGNDDISGEIWVVEACEGQDHGRRWEVKKLTGQVLDTSSSWILRSPQIITEVRLMRETGSPGLNLRPSIRELNGSKGASWSLKAISLSLSCFI